MGLSTGGIRPPEILVNAPRRTEAPSSRDELFLEGYGRQFGEKMTYSVGLTYGLGLFAGGTYGALMGLRQGGATSKLFINSVLNSCSRYGPAAGNQSAIITMYYVGFTNLIPRRTEAPSSRDELFLEGLYKVAARSWQPVAKYSAASCALFCAVDY